MSDDDPRPLTTAEASARFMAAWYRFMADFSRSLRLPPEHWDRQSAAAEARRWRHREETLRGL